MLKYIEEYDQEKDCEKWENEAHIEDCDVPDKPPSRSQCFN